MWNDKDPMHVGTAEDLLPDAAEQARQEAERVRKETDEQLEQAAYDRARKEIKKKDEEDSSLFGTDAQDGVNSLFGSK